MFLIEYVKKHKITFFSVVITFIIGIIIGIFITFKIPENDKEDIKKYINDTIQTSKDNKIDKQYLFKEKLLDNFKVIGIIWLLGCTIIASFTIYFFMIYKGVIFGYITASIIYVFGFNKEIKFLIITIIVKKILFLPIAFLLATSGIILYKEIIQRKNNIKQELLRHTIIMLVSSVFSLIVSFIDAYILTSLLHFL